MKSLPLPLRLVVGSCLLLSAISAPAWAEPALVNVLTVPGNATDLTPVPPGTNSANINRLGGFGSDLVYAKSDPANNQPTGTPGVRRFVFYGEPDRGPGGGVISYENRIQKFTLDIDLKTGAISNFQLVKTIPLTIQSPNTTVGGLTFASGTAFNGLNPSLDPLNGNPAILGRSLDSEGLAVLTDGSFIVSDEYGPSIYRFDAGGAFIGAFDVPSAVSGVNLAPNLLPKIADGSLNYVNGRSDDPALTFGRQDNRGFEGFTIAGNTAYALLQDPLVNEGSSSDGRNSRNIRLSKFDLTSGTNLAQYVYPLESLATINARVPSDPFKTNQQGRSIGISAITPLPNGQLLVLERDNRGIGVDDPTGSTPVSTKRVYKIDTRFATDVSTTSLVGIDALPDNPTGGIIPVIKTPTVFDLLGLLQAAGQVVPEKIEGLAVGPALADGSLVVIAITDNDFSVTQDDNDVQFDVCVDAPAYTTSSEVPIDAPCPSGQSLIPTFIYSFKINARELLLAPGISSFTPAGSVGSVVTIEGSGLRGTSQVQFAGGKSAKFKATAAGTVIKAVVPTGAATGPITITAPGGTIVTPAAFTVQ
ncbi:esterase-like activity of phytase family protein [Gloeobacter kilaueensis]|uniref:Phytase-like domain-containing protein n=1 Tax=Gloeobacter kilaueensis (strain ATCC BAA-2537 / CCAP 1431/1 / ULC 316 / JS1) TaxID=1183438 RepID=U5QP26_GLOK1|nr:esterase-like activity of phytase family protein [Gloeobacter kilaueensis]AGY59314.1 hypothetical protein GKIL_3068 [Gloeobacter kilaueensis JS1]